MFRLNDKYVYEPGPNACRLHAFYGYDPEFYWTVDLCSANTRIRVGGEIFDSSCGLLIKTPIELKTWQDPEYRRFDLIDFAEVPMFSFAYDSVDWEDVKELTLEFGETREDTIRVEAKGTAFAEAAEDVFPSCEIAFQIDCSVRFTGVTVNVPLNAIDHDSHAKKLITEILPSFEYRGISVRKTNDKADCLLAAEYVFTPTSDDFFSDK